MFSVTEKSAVVVIVAVIALCRAFSYNPDFSNRKRPLHNRVVACYVTNWSIYRSEQGEFTIDDIRPEYCTHLIYAFAGLNGSTFRIRSLDPWADLEEHYGKGGYKKVTKLKYHYPGLKVSLAVGGWKEGSANYSAMARNEHTRRRFVESAVDFLRYHNFDGLDLDWEYPTQRDGHPSDKQNFVLLVKELKQAFREHNFMLTAAISGNKNVIREAYEVYELSKHLDFFHVMTYDYNGLWNRRVLPNAPLGFVEETVQELIDQGAPLRKLIVGLPFYGLAYIMTKMPRSQQENPIGSDALSTSFQGPYSNQDGFLGYNEICKEFSENEAWVRGWDKLTDTPYAVQGNRVIVYDDARSLTVKVNLAMKYRLGGVMVWSIDTDDFRGECSVLHQSERYFFPADSKFPLLQSITRALERNPISSANVFNSMSLPILTLVSFVVCRLR